MGRFLTILLLFVLGGCFLVVSHDDRSPEIVTVHLLPPKLEEAKPERAVDANVAIFPFNFDLKFSEKKTPVYLDYSQIPKEFAESLSVMLESGFVSKAEFFLGVDSQKDAEYYARFVKEKKMDFALFGRVAKFDIAKNRGTWSGNIEYEIAIVAQDGVILKREKKEYSFEALALPESVTLDYQAAMAATMVMSRVYADVAGSIKALSPQLEAHRTPRELVKGKGIFTFRKTAKFKGKARVIVDVRIRILINDISAGLLPSKEKKTDAVKSIIDEIVKRGDYKLVINVRDESETIYPFKNGKLAFDPGGEAYILSYAVSKEYNVVPGKGLVVATFQVPRLKDVVTKGLYIEVNPEKGSNLGFNLICDTKNNFVDMVFVK